MRIGVDARELLGNLTGVGRYLAELLRVWSTQPAAANHEFLLYAPGAAERIERWTHCSNVEHYRIRLIRGRGTTLWEQTSLAAALLRDRPDVLFAPGYTAPILTRVPLVVTVHDVAYFDHPEWFTHREGARRRHLTRLSTRQARTVITDSEFSARQIRHWLGDRIERLEVIPLAARCYTDTASPERRDPLVLFVGSLFNRRRIPELLKVFREVARRHPDLRLAMVGDNRTHPRLDPNLLAGSMGIASMVDIWSYVNEATLLDLYRRARAFVFLSEYEGFGLPPLEALCAGIPALVTDTPVAREIYGDAVLYAPLGDLAGTAQQLERLMFDDAARAQLLERAAALLRRLNWETTASRTLEVLEVAARNGSA